MTNSGAYEGMTNEEGHGRHLQRRGASRLGASHDDLPPAGLADFRQRYWGTPIPMVYCDVLRSAARSGIGGPACPVLLPEDAEFRPTGRVAAGHQRGVREHRCARSAAGRDAGKPTPWTPSWTRRGTCCATALPQFDGGPFEAETAADWMPVRQYTGGAEHAVMHLLYSRFFIKSLRDMGMLDIDEPFLRLFNQGVILGSDHEKMSKSRGNVVNPMTTWWDRWAPMQSAAS